MDDTKPAGVLLATAGQFALQLAERADYALRTAKVLLNRPLEADLAAIRPVAHELAKSMATPEQHAAARAAVKERMPAYAKIFSKHENRLDQCAAEPDSPARPVSPADSRVETRKGLRLNGNDKSASQDRAQPGPIRLPSAPALGFDLDLTLIDMRAATAYALEQVNERLTVCVDVDAVLADLGAPFREQLAQWIPPHRMTPALRVFLDAFLSGGLDLIVPMPGAAAVLAAVAERNGRAVVVTGRRASVARACLRRCGMAVDAITGGVTGTGKAPALRQHRLDAFVGDHPLDMAGAVAAGIPGIGVLNGTRTAGELLAAGAAATIPTLEELADQLVG